MGEFLKSPSRRRASRALRSLAITAVRITFVILEWKVCLNPHISSPLFTIGFTFLYIGLSFRQLKCFTTFIWHLSSDEKIDDFMIESSQMSCLTLPLVIRQQNLFRHLTDHCHLSITSFAFHSGSDSLVSCSVSNSCKF